MIRARDLSKRYGAHRVLEHVNVHVAAGERVALLGLNGAGKTTLIRCLLGLTRFEGDLEVGGFDVRRQGREARARLGYVPQRAPHFDGTLREMVEFFARLRDVSPDAIEAPLRALDLPMDAHGEKPVRVLSGGMLQKILLALALGSDVRLLLLDEPTANLDPRARRGFLRALRQVGGDRTILLASHRLADVDAVADRLLVLHEGRIAFDGATRTLWDRVSPDVTLWIQVPPAVRPQALAHLESRCRLDTVQANGAAVGVTVDRAGRADVIADLRIAGVVVEDFWTETPSLGDLLEHVLEQGHTATGADHHGSG